VVDFQQPKEKIKKNPEGGAQCSNEPLQRFGEPGWKRRKGAKVEKMGESTGCPEEPYLGKDLR